MPEYGVTDKGFVIKRLDTIIDEIHDDLTEGLGIDTRLLRPSFLDTLVTTFAGQIADIWEDLQDQYYAKYPATATGVNLDNAVQYGGIRRSAGRKTCYPLHCTGDDGAYIHENSIVATDTLPEIRLVATEEYQITRESCNAASITVAVVQDGAYTVNINGNQYSYSNSGGDENSILEGLKSIISNPDYTVSVSDGMLVISDNIKTRSNKLVLSDNLTTANVTSIAVYETEEYGRVTLPHGIVSKLVENVTGLTSVTNLLEPTYGRDREGDIELRQSYIAKSGLRSNTMLDSIRAELINNVENVETATGYENYTDETDSRGLPPHSIEIVVEGGDESDIAQAILRRKAGGIQTFGKVEVLVAGVYGDSIPVRFNRPDYLYTWIKIVIHGDPGKLPTNYVKLTSDSIITDGKMMEAGTSLLLQLLTEGIYDAVSGITYIDIYTAYSTDRSYIPSSGDYKQQNIIATSRQKVLIDEERIEVTFNADS